MNMKSTFINMIVKTTLNLDMEEHKKVADPKKDLLIVSIPSDVAKYSFFPRKVWNSFSLQFWILFSFLRNESIVLADKISINSPSIRSCMELV
jgi:hypothetical protein